MGIAVRQEIAQQTAGNANPVPRESRTHSDELSSYLAVMALVVGLIIAWVCLCGA
ncbi:MAG TPA: hypothetical protein VFN42_11450 [Acetobacteraceae bacterium]|nr:hypothetical protein [Acetobacteraceae bacterium]